MLTEASECISDYLCLSASLWLTPGAVGAQQRPAYLFKGQVVQSRKADPEAQDQINEALKTF